MGVFFRSWTCLLGIVLGFRAGADAFYPKAVPVRYFGSNQGQVASCMAEAEVTALEHVFANRGYPVKLSLFYRHAKVWQNLDRSNGAALALSYSPADIAILNSAGSLIPDYMWPEDGGGMDPRQSGPLRPSVSEQALIDPAFPTAESLGFQLIYKTFEPGHANSAGVAQLRANVVAGNAVTLSIHGALLGSLTSIFNDETGLLASPYSTSEIASILNQDASHAVAVVGFDDSLEAFLIRNSWNTADEIERTSKTNVSTQVLNGLKKMRLKIAPRNLPGYYALPYAYVNDLAARGKGGYAVITLNFAAYGEAYLKFSAKYSVINAPFSCDPEMAQFAVGKFWADRRVVQKAKAKDGNLFQEEMQNVVMNEASRGKETVFSFAKLPSNPEFKEDRLSEFYSGVYAKYYCGSGRQWPNADFNSLRARDPRFDQIIKLISSESTSPLGWARWFNTLAEGFEKGIFKL